MGSDFLKKNRGSRPASIHERPPVVFCLAYSIIFLIV